MRGKEILSQIIAQYQILKDTFKVIIPQLPKNKKKLNFNNYCRYQFKEQINIMIKEKELWNQCNQFFKKYLKNKQNRKLLPQNKMTIQTLFHRLICRLQKFVFNQSQISQLLNEINRNYQLIQQWGQSQKEKNKHQSTITPNYYKLKTKMKTHKPQLKQSARQQQKTRPQTALNSKILTQKQIPWLQSKVLPLTKMQNNLDSNMTVNSFSPKSQTKISRVVRDTNKQMKSTTSISVPRNQVQSKSNISEFSLQSSFVASSTAPMTSLSAIVTLNMKQQEKDIRKGFFQLNVKGVENNIAMEKKNSEQQVSVEEFIDMQPIKKQCLKTRFNALFHQKQITSTEQHQQSISKSKIRKNKETTIKDNRRGKYYTQKQVDKIAIQKFKIDLRNTQKISQYQNSQLGIIDDENVELGVSSRRIVKSKKRVEEEQINLCIYQQEGESILNQKLLFHHELHNEVDKSSCFQKSQFFKQQNLIQKKRKEQEKNEMLKQYIFDMECKKSSKDLFSEMNRMTAFALDTGWIQQHFHIRNDLLNQF